MENGPSMPSTARRTASAQRGAGQSLSASGFMRGSPISKKKSASWAPSVFFLFVKHRGTGFAGPLVLPPEGGGRPTRSAGNLGVSLQRINKTAQLVRTRRVLELAQRLGFDLADALARHVELLADFFLRVVGRHP